MVIRIYVATAATSASAPRVPNTMLHITDGTPDIGMVINFHQKSDGYYGVGFGDLPHDADRAHTYMAANAGTSNARVSLGFQQIGDPSPSGYAPMLTVVKCHRQRPASAQPDPSEVLEVNGNVRADQFLTGDIVFHKGDKPVWRMYEDEKGLYVQSLTTDKNYALVFEELGKEKEASADAKDLNTENLALKAKVSNLEARLAKIESLLNAQQ